jgi:hypothetical protein
MQTKRERDVIKRISKQYGRVIDLERAPGVMIEILRDFGPDILHVLDDNGTGGGGPGVSSIAIAGPGSGTVTTEDLMRVVLELRKEVIRLSERVSGGRGVASRKRSTASRK